MITSVSFEKSHLREISQEQESERRIEKLRMTLCNFCRQYVPFCVAKLAARKCFRARKQKMGKSCCAIGCANCYTKVDSTSIIFLQILIRELGGSQLLTERTGNRTSTHGLVVLAFLVV